MINPGKFNKLIEIFEKVESADAAGFPTFTEKTVLKTYAYIKTTKGYTLITSNSDFEKALTNFTIRWPVTLITRKMFIKFNNKIYSIEYLNNVDEENIYLEIQAKVVVQ